MLDEYLKLEEIINSQQQTIKLQQELINQLSLENINLNQLVNELMTEPKRDPR